MVNEAYETSFISILRMDNDLTNYLENLKQYKSILLYSLEEMIKLYHY